MFHRPRLLRPAKGIASTTCSIKQSLGIGQRSMEKFLNQQDGGGGSERGVAVAVNTSFQNGPDDGENKEKVPLGEENVESIRQRTAAFLLGEGR